jgi:hypothetical protein
MPNFRSSSSFQNMSFLPTCFAVSSRQIETDKNVSETQEIFVFLRIIFFNFEYCNYPVEMVFNGKQMEKLWISRSKISQIDSMLDKRSSKMAFDVRHLNGSYQETARR